MGNMTSTILGVPSTNAIFVPRWEQAGERSVARAEDLFFARWELIGWRKTRMRVMECLAYVARSFHDRDSRPATYPSFPAERRLNSLACSRLG